MQVKYDSNSSQNYCNFLILLFFIIYILTSRIPVSSFTACKARDSIIMAIYSRLFELLTKSINQVSKSEAALNILITDIAGFGNIIIILWTKQIYNTQN